MPFNWVCGARKYSPVLRCNHRYNAHRVGGRVLFLVAQSSGYIKFPLFARGSKPMIYSETQSVTHCPVASSARGQPTRGRAELSWMARMCGFAAPSTGMDRDLISYASPPAGTMPPPEGWTAHGLAEQESSGRVRGARWARGAVEREGGGGYITVAALLSRCQAQ